MQVGSKVRLTPKGVLNLIDNKAFPRHNKNRVYTVEAISKTYPYDEETPGVFVYENTYSKSLGAWHKMDFFYSIKAAIKKERAVKALEAKRQRAEQQALEARRLQDEKEFSKQAEAARYEHKRQQEILHFLTTSKFRNDDFFDLDVTFVAWLPDAKPHQRLVYVTGNGTVITRYQTGQKYEDHQSGYDVVIA